ncbi:MAG: hypothetical protein J6M42_05120 [Clostridia bacterium]|nr:hypothetical protein [Clostridia bacterium]
MKRRSILILIALLTLTLCLGLAACRGDDPTADTTDAPTSPDTPDESGEAPTDESTETPTEAPTEPETDPVPEPINRSEYPKEQAGAKSEVVLKAADFGVKGDGVTNDGPAIGRAIEAAMEQQATLQFESGKVYYIGSTDRSAGPFGSPFAMQGADGVTVDGGGSVFRFAPGISYFAMTDNRDVRICNMKLDLSVSPYLVGTVKAVNGASVTYTTDIEPNQSFNDSRGYTNFSIEYNEGKQERPHRFINTMTKTASKEIKVEYQTESHGYAVGDKVFVPNPGIGNALSEIMYIASNTGCMVFENIEVWAAPSFIANIRDNDAELYFENVDYIPGEENDREIKMVSWRDGYHVKDNRRPIHWNECDVGVLFDDVFNVSNTLGYITSVKNGNQMTVTQYEMYTHGSYHPFNCRVGDVIEVFSTKGVYAGLATVRRVTQNPNGTTDLVLEYGDNLKKMETGWLVGNRDTCAPGSTVTNSRFTGTFRFRRDIRIENCVFDMLITWIREDGSVEGPIPGNIDYVGCTFNGGSLDIGAAGTSVRSAMKDIGFWGCTFNDGAKIAKGRNVTVTEADTWTEEELYTYKNRKLTKVPVNVVPTEMDLVNTVTYDWSYIRMQVEGGKLLSLSKLEDTDIREKLLANDGFADRVLVLTGGENGTRYLLGGLSAEFLPGFHAEGKSYMFSINYYATAAGGTAGFLKGDTATTVKSHLFDTANAIGNAACLYNPEEGATGFYVEVPAGATVYIGKVNITATSSKNPSTDQLYNGHTFIWSKDLTIGKKGEALNYDAISDETVRNAILNAESGFTSGVVLHVNGAMGDFTGFTDKEYYVQGKTYHLSIDAYIASPMVPQDGTKIYLLAMDDTPGNRLLAEGLFTGEGFYHFEMDWTVGSTGEKSLKFFINNTPAAYADIYIGDFTVTMAKSLKPDVFLSRNDFHTLTQEELKAGYTFDFTEGKLMDTGVLAYASTALLPEKTATLLRENGFGDTFYYANENFTFGSLPNDLTGGRKLRITMQVYDVLGNLANTLPRGAFVLLHMQGGIQNSAEVSYKIETDPDNSRLLTVTFDTNTPGGTDDLLFYGLTTVEYLIGSITIQQLN